MAAFWVSSICLALVTNVFASYDSGVCPLLKTSEGLIPPPLPTNFEMKGEEVDRGNNTAAYIEIYFDYDNSRYKYMYLQNGIEHHFLFDYHTQQVVEWDVLHPGMDFKRDPLSQVCTAQEMETLKYKGAFGYKLNDEMLPKMYTSNQALRYGGQYMYAADGTERLFDRGLLTDKFRGCVYDKSIDATFRTTFYFTEKNVIPSGGSISMVVTGEETGYLPVPVKMEYDGFVDNFNDEEKALNTTYNINWFKAEPKFRVGTFQIPPYVYCTNYRGRKDMPTFPKAFSTRLVTTQMQVNILGEMEVQESSSYEQIYYYAEKNLARRDFTPSEFLDTEIYTNFKSLDPVSTIYDFNEGILYTTHKASGRCYIRPIYRNDYFDKTGDSIYTILAPPEQIFHMQTDKMEYKGKAFVRDIECDVWTGKVFDNEYNATVVKETYITTNGWHEESDEVINYKAPIKHVVMKKELDGDLSKGISVYNFLKFEAKPPMLRSFDIRNCLESISHKELAILLAVDSKTRTTIFDYKYQFLETAQYYLTEITNVFTPLRIQRLHLRELRKGEVKTFLVFTIADKASLRTQVPVGQKGSSLEDAIVKLQNFTNRNQFFMKFYPGSKKEAVNVEARSGSLYQVTSTGILSLEPKSAPVDLSAMSAYTEVPKVKIFHSDEDNEDVEVKEGMKTGSLVFLAFAMLFIGVGIGIAAMYLYIRFKGQRVGNDIALYQKSDPSTSG